MVFPQDNPMVCSGSTIGTRAGMRNYLRILVAEVFLFVLPCAFLTAALLWLTFCCIDSYTRTF